MRKNTLTIIKKEFYRFFRDWRMILTAIIFPAVLTYALYAFLGDGMISSMTPDDKYMPVCHVQNLPESYETLFEKMNFQLHNVTDPESAKALVAQKDADLLVIFPADFDEKLQNTPEGALVPNIMVYYNSTNTESDAAYDLFQQTTAAFEASMTNALDINRDVLSPDLASNEDFASVLVASLLPMMLIFALFTGCVSFSTESIAGEKERGTIATLLVTPTSRTSIAIGKVVSMSIFALLAGIAEFISCMLSIPNMSGSLVNMDVYGMQEFVALLAVIIATVLLLVSILSVVSTYSKTVKEATSMSTLLMLASMFASFLPMFSIDFSGITWRLIPVLNSILCLSDIFSFEYSLSAIAITCVSNLVYMLGFVFILSKMFNSEKIMFNK